MLLEITVERQETTVDFRGKLVGLLLKRRRTLSERSTTAHAWFDGNSAQVCRRDHPGSRPTGEAAVTRQVACRNTEYVGEFLQRARVGALALIGNSQHGLLVNAGLLREFLERDAFVEPEAFNFLAKRFAVIGGCAHIGNSRSGDSVCFRCRAKGSI